MATEDNERSFRSFANALLAVEETVHRSGEVTLYTPDALQDILGEFCEIIATHLDAQSCTIQLKLHDIASCKFIDQMTRKKETPPYDVEEVAKRADGRSLDEAQRIQAYRERVASDFLTAWEAAGGECLTLPSGPAKGDRNRRNTVLRSPGTFPYCIYPKGAMWLVASNRTSPWAPFVDWLITDLRAGVTAEIVQEKSPRVRDPFTIRKSRSFRKLGPVDPWLWTNQYPERMGSNMSPRYFLNFYAVPIRIHSGGDVIGILKIENKGFAYEGPGTLHHAIEGVVRSAHSRVFTTMLATLAQNIVKAEEDAKQSGFEGWKRSLLSLVALAFDLSGCRPTNEPPTVEEFLTATYGEPARGADVPPVQVLFDDVDQEDAFFLGTPATPSGTRPHLDVIRKFYEGLNAWMAERSTKLRVRQRLTEFITAFARDHHPGTTVEVIPATKPYPDFFYQVRGARADGEVFHFHVQVCPRVKESGRVKLLVDYWEMPEDRARKYRTVRRKQTEAVELAGEYIDGKDRIIHLRTDRLAMRIQALTYAFPVPPFLPTDSRKLSWAALEIGKLIERQISYRGTHSAPTVPLTADDFFRIPISDLSFVDAVRRQHDDAEALRSSLWYHLPNLCADLDFSWGVEHSQRVKRLRSYFDRLGQSHRAEYDALIALWSYLLHRKMTDDERAKITDAASGIPSLLDELCARIDDVWKEDQSKPDGPEKWKEELNRWLDDDATFPDLRFSVPALDLSPDLREKALKCLRYNLTRCPTGMTKHDLRSDFTPAELTDLLFRRYDAFVTRATSLYLQLRNEHRGTAAGTGYMAFYRTTRTILERLRNRLETLEEQVTRAPQRDSPVGKLSETIGKLRVEVLSLSTGDLAEKFGKVKPSDEELLRFSVQGIYKRIRTLANVSGNQCGPALLNWENGRFDYLGARLTCLFKNQVFAAYEEVWSRGDPFRPKPPSKTRAAALGGSASRQRWICTRTRVHAGDAGYNAWQVSALMDPFAISDSFWDDNAYTLNVLRDILTAAHRQWDGDIDTYDRVAAARLTLKRQYSKWFLEATKLLDRPPAVRQKRTERLFGEYLGEWPLDVLVHVLRKDAKAEAGSRIIPPGQLKEILAILGRFVAESRVYSELVLDVIRGREKRAYSVSEDSALLKSGQDLYEWTIALVERGETGLPKDTVTRLQAQKKIFQSESRRAESPLVYMHDSARTEIAEIAQWVGSSAGAHQRGLRALEKAVRRVQGMQMDYLFDLPGDKTAAPPLRSQSDVMDRIVCYILLHRISAYEHLSKAQRKAVHGAADAYNLFYYVMSLVPVEIQIRTALANTMADQYHRIYKIGSDALSETQIQQERLMSIGQELEVIDRVFEVQFEDYIAQKST
jgi:hypothetical protein